jgi:predicted Zn-dependent protease with MMP-like domain
MASWPYHHHVDAVIRRKFDALLEQVLEELPPPWRGLLEQVPLVVEDRPSRRLAREMEIESDDELCGLYTGTPLTERSVEQSGTMPEEILIFRMGVLAEAADDADRISDVELKKQIRITVLHEMGHHFGMEEEALKELGYE